MEWKSLCCVRLFAAPWTAARQAPPVHRILQAKILEWVAIPFSRRSSWPRDRTQVSCIAGRFFTVWAAREAPKRNLFLPGFELGTFHVWGKHGNHYTTKTGLLCRDGWISQILEKHVEHRQANVLSCLRPGFKNWPSSSLRSTWINHSTSRSIHFPPSLGVGEKWDNHTRSNVKPYRTNGKIFCQGEALITHR